MKVRELIAALASLPPEKEVVVYDGDGGGMQPVTGASLWPDNEPNVVAIEAEDGLYTAYSMSASGRLIQPTTKG